MSVFLCRFLLNPIDIPQYFDYILYVELDLITYCFYVMISNYSIYSPIFYKSRCSVANLFIIQYIIKNHIRTDIVHEIE